MRNLAVIWGLGGFLYMIGSACYRLTPRALEAFRFDLTALHYVALVLWIVFMVYSEAYRGFHKAFAPRFAARLKHLYREPRPLHVALAPLFAMTLFYSTRKRKIVAWCLVVGIVALVLLIKQVSQPWRGIVDLGVIIGLALGTASVVYYTVLAFTSDSFSHSPDLPE